MTTLFDATAPVKVNPAFGAGLVGLVGPDPAQAPAPAPAPDFLGDDELAAIDARIALMERLGDEYRARFGFAVASAGVSRPFDPSPEDRAWWADESARMTEARVDRAFDRRAHASHAVDAVCRGLIPRDLASEIARTSLVGHPG